MMVVVTVKMMTTEQTILQEPTMQMPEEKTAETKRPTVVIRLMMVAKKAWVTMEQKIPENLFSTTSML